MIFDEMEREEIEKEASKIEEMARKGVHRNDIKLKLPSPHFDELYEIAAARVKNEKAGKTRHRLFMTLEDLRFATSETIADYRASRLKCGTIVDAGCGIGLQSFAFAKTCEKVYAIEIDERKIRYAMENAKVLGIDNIEFIAGDALKAKDSIKKADIVFSETQREAEAAERNIEALQPNVNGLMQAYGKMTDKFCIDVPPQMKELPENCEKEYVSVEHDLNRLNLYFGGLKRCNKAAVALPGMHRIEEGGKKAELRKTDAMKYLYEIDDAVIKAGLTRELAAVAGLNSMITDSIFTSNEIAESPFFKGWLEVLQECRNDFSSILRALQAEKAGKVILRQKIAPEKYWEERKRYEKSLKGSKTVHLFVLEEKAIVCNKIK